MSKEHSQTKRQAVEQFLSGRLKQVDVVAIERELGKLWQEAAGSSTDSAASIVARACVHNLILYSCEDEAEISAADILDKLTVKHPCRALLAIDLASDLPSIEAWVSARCHLASPDSSKHICCEQITIKSYGMGPEALPSVTLPLLIPDLPVFLWWHTLDLDKEKLDAFLPHVDALIIDSLSWELDSKYFADLVKIMDGYDIAITDLNWSRLTHWRHLIAKSFDSLAIGLSIETLQEIENVRIEYASNGTAQAALLTSWLANQLNWQAKQINATGGVTELLFEHALNTVRVEWIEKSSNIAPAGNVLNIEMTMAKQCALKIQLGKLDSGNILSARTTSNLQESKAASGKGPDYDEANLVACQLERQEPDSVYSRATKMASQLSLLAAQED